MKYLLLPLAIVAFVIMACGAGQKKNNDKISSINVTEFKEVLKNPNVICIDVRTPQEFNEGHIENALNINVMDKDFAQKVIKAVAEDKDIAVYCRSGKRSMKAANILVKEGMNKIYNLKGGYKAWSKESK